MLGTINIVNDINLAVQCNSQGCKVVYIGELGNIPPQFVECPMLLPPYQALNAEINGDMNSYYSQYTAYLDQNKECYGTIMTIIVSVFMGSNVIFYIENGTELHHQQFLMEYFLNKFGMVLGYKNVTFTILQQWYPMLYALCYEFIGSNIFDPNMVICYNNIQQLISYVQMFPFAGNLFNRLFNDIGCISLEELEKYRQLIYKFWNAEGGFNLVVKRDQK